eukprot:TRINITY_DN34048_c0_g1_i1.p1 TRINITY_DN34048_c0_g1~~TRINITY_DN34048_c0_g1_i1.p1  ORF type:complete len:287 (+),score=69.30 TRINITY_DN34048_c0_g1_i1:60-863(+)
MKPLRIYQIDAFASKAFEGNPAAVVPLEEWIEDSLMQSVAAENNLAETVYFVKEADSGYRIRWFTPVAEVKLCGHATLAAAYIMFTELGVKEDVIEFQSLSGKLTVTRINEKLELCFPLQEPSVCKLYEDINAGLKVTPKECLAAEDLIAVFDDPQMVVDMEPDFDVLSRLPYRGLIVTAKAPDSLPGVDFITRFFAPKIGIREDPVTGSAYTQVGPYWANVLGRSTLTAVQMSQRRGTVDLTVDKESQFVRIRGNAVLFMKGEICL